MFLMKKYVLSLLAVLPYTFYKIKIIHSKSSLHNYFWRANQNGRLPFNSYLVLPSFISARVWSLWKLRSWILLQLPLPKSAGFKMRVSKRFSDLVYFPSKLKQCRSGFQSWWPWLRPLAFKGPWPAAPMVTKMDSVKDPIQTGPSETSIWVSWLRLQRR